MTISPLSEMSFVSDAVSAKPGQMLQNVQKAQSDASDSNFQSLIDSVSRAQEAPVKVSDNKQMDNSSKSTSENEVSKVNEAADATEGKEESTKLNTEKNDSLSNHKDVNAEETDKVTEELKDKILNEAAKKLGISVEDLENVLSQLGITAADLLNTDNVSALVSNVLGDGDRLSLLTDENALNIVNELNQVISDLVSEAAETLEMIPEEVGTLLENIEMTADKAAIAPTVISENDVTGDSLKEVNSATEKTDSNVNGDIKNAVADTITDSSEISVQDARNSKNAESSDKDGHTDSDINKQDDTSSYINNLASEVNTSFDEIVVNDEPQITGSVANAQEILNQVQSQIKAQFSDGMTALQMQLNPENLGTVNMTIASKEGNVTAQLNVENETVKEALESQIQQVRESLEAQGVKITAIEVTVSSHGFEQNLEKGNDENAQQEAVNEELKKSTRKLNLSDGLTDTLIEELDDSEIVTAKMMAADGNTMDYKV